MGFTSIIAATQLASNALNNYQQGQYDKAQARATAQVGEAQARLMERDATANDAIALQNNRMRRRNAQSELASVRADNAVSNLVSDGTGLTREIDMATRLEHEIDIQTDEALRQSSNMRNQAAFTRWDTGLQVSNLKRQAHGNNMSAIGNLAGLTAVLGKEAWDAGWLPWSEKANKSTTATAKK